MRAVLLPTTSVVVSITNAFSTSEPVCLVGKAYEIEGRENAWVAAYHQPVIPLFDSQQVLSSNPSLPLFTVPTFWDSVPPCGSLRRLPVTCVAIVRWCSISAVRLFFRSPRSSFTHRQRYPCIQRDHPSTLLFFFLPISLFVDKLI